MACTLTLTRLGPSLVSNSVSAAISLSSSLSMRSASRRGVSRRKYLRDAPPQKMPRGSAKKFLRRRADHHGARIAREQEQAIFKPRHHRVHILPHGAENFVHATQLLTNLRNLPAHESEFVGALGDALGV